MCQKRDVELCVPISAGVTYRVAEMQRVGSHPLLRPRAVRLPVDENLQAIALKW